MIILWVLSIIISTALCWKHDRALTGFMLGFFLGPLGALITLFLRMHWSASAARDEQIEILRKLVQQKEGQTTEKRVERDLYALALENAYGDKK